MFQQAAASKDILLVLYICFALASWRFSNVEAVKHVGVEYIMTTAQSKYSNLINLRQFNEKGPLYVLGGFFAIFCQSGPIKTKMK